MSLVLLSLHNPLTGDARLEFLRISYSPEMHVSIERAGGPVGYQPTT